MRAAGSLLVVAVALAATGCTQTPQERIATQQANAATADRLAKELAGLTPGQSTTCMPRSGNTQVEAFGPTILYTVSRSLKYRSDTTGGCERVGRGDILVTRSPSGQLCQGDIATTIDQTARTLSGSCSFGPFVRYSKQGS